MIFNLVTKSDLEKSILKGIMESIITLDKSKSYILVFPEELELSVDIAKQLAEFTKEHNMFIIQSNNLKLIEL